MNYMGCGQYWVTYASATKCFENYMWHAVLTKNGFSATSSLHVIFSAEESFKNRKERQSGKKVIFGVFF